MMNSHGGESLFSTIISLYTLLLLYVPAIFLRFVFSPIVFSTLILLLYLLRLGSSQKSTIDLDSEEFDSVQSFPRQIEEFDLSPDRKPKARPFYAESFVEWDVRAPLEVIFEEYEGEDAEENESEARRESEMNIIRRYASLSLFYPESDSDASSEGDYTVNGGCGSPEKLCFRWEEEDDREGLIEIALDEKRNREVDEENFIEIDLSPASCVLQLNFCEM